MPSATQRRGGQAEDRAVFYLRRHGYRILDRHLTSRFGEIDIVAEKQGTIYIVEVKYRRSERGWPLEVTMTEKKIERLVLTYQAHTPSLINHRLRCLWLLLTPTTIREVVI